jgi:hypothetical protein
MFSHCLKKSLELATHVLLRVRHALTSRIADKLEGQPRKIHTCFAVNVGLEVRTRDMNMGEQVIDVQTVDLGSQKVVCRSSRYCRHSILSIGTFSAPFLEA